MAINFSHPFGPVRKLALAATLAVSFLWNFAESRAVIPACGNGGPAYLTNFVVNATAQGLTVRFDIAGGTSGMVYDILTAANPLMGGVSNAPWTTLGQGSPCGTYTFSNQPAAGAFYALSLPVAGPVYLTNFVCVASVTLGTTAKFDIAGGGGNVLYDILTTTNLADGSAYWTWLGQGYPRGNYAFNQQPGAQAYYALGPPPASMVVAWGDDSRGQCDVPAGLTNAVAVAGGTGFSLALGGDGRVTAWGDNTYNQTNVPVGLSNAVAIAAGPYHSLALRADGSVVAWGTWWPGSFVPVGTVPPTWTNIIAIAAGADHDLALKADGTVLAWGYTNEAYDSVPTNLPRATALAAGWNHNVVVLTNGSVAAWGINGAALGWNLTTVPTNLNNAVAVSASALHTLAVRADGTVSAWGFNGDGQTSVPPGLSNVVSVATGEAHSLALRRDGTIALWGDFGSAGPASLPYNLTGVTAIGPGGNHCLVICSTRSLPLIKQQPPASQTQTASGSATFSIQGQAVGAVTYQWQFNGTNIAGATNATLTITNLQSGAQGNYRVVMSNAGGATISSNAALSMLPLPAPAVTAWTKPTNAWINFQKGLLLSLTVSNAPGVPPAACQWQWNGANIFANQPLPYNFKINAMGAAQEGMYSAIVSNASGSRRLNWNVHVAWPGGVALWGADDFGQSDRPMPAATNIVGIAAGQSNSVALMSDGTVTQWGFNWGSVPAGLTNATAVAAGYSHALALRGDGTVVSWGLPGDPANIVPATLTGVKGIAAGWNHNLALLTNGTVTAWGVNGVSLGWHLTEVPAGLSNVVAVTAGSLHSLALRTNGTVVAWGFSLNGETNVPAGLSNVVAVAGGGQHSLALRADGTVVAWGFNGSGQCSVPAGLNNVIAVSAGWAHSVALKNDGTLVAWGDDSRGQTEAPTNLTNVKFIAAGGYHNVAAMFSQSVPYALDAAKDLLLVCNTNSPDSVNVLNYYLQNRPLAARANVLAVSCTNGEIILPADFTNQINTPLRQWLAANPAKRPGYVVLFLDVPSRVGDPANPLAVQPSVSYQIATGITNWRPLVTHLNMGDTNACIAYINKIAAMGSNYSPGKLLVSAGAGGGLGDTNYVFDNVRNGAGHGDNYGFCWWLGPAASNGVAQNGVPSSAVFYADGIETVTNGVSFNLPHLTIAANVAGWFSWGAHSSLGSQYAINGELRWTGKSSWFLAATTESDNGQRNNPPEGNFIQWFSAGAFGGSNYANTPVGAATHVEEPGLNGIEDMSAYFGSWAAGQNFATCAWAARNTPYFMAVGDPLVSR